MLELYISCAGQSLIARLSRADENGVGAKLALKMAQAVGIGGDRQAA